MAYRKCPNHGWLETEGYKPRVGDAELVCKRCETPVEGFRL